VLVEFGVRAASEPIQAGLTDAAREVRDQVHGADFPSVMRLRYFSVRYAKLARPKTKQ